MPDFWRHSGFHLLGRDADGRLVVNDDFLRAYYLRPEIRPVADSGPNEIALHTALMESPRQDVSAAQLEAIEDADTRFNYGVLLDFRRRLLASPSLEACYRELFVADRVPVPPLFVDQLAQIILRNVLDGTGDALQARAGELFFREQQATIEHGAVMLADRETIERHASGGVYGNLGRLIAEAQTPLQSAQLDVLDAAAPEVYWSRDERHDFVIGLNHGRPAAAALGRVIERWIAHFTRAAVKVETVAGIDEERWAWHIGLDAQSSALLNDLWRGGEVETGRMRRLLLLLRMEFAEPLIVDTKVRGRPVYLALAMDEANTVRLKPQNLLLNLPLASAS